MEEFFFPFVILLLLEFLLCTSPLFTYTFFLHFWYSCSNAFKCRPVSCWAINSICYFLFVFFFFNFFSFHWINYCVVSVSFYLKCFVRWLSFCTSALCDFLFHSAKNHLFIRQSNRNHKIRMAYGLPWFVGAWFICIQCILSILSISAYRIKWEEKKSSIKRR